MLKMNLITQEELYMGLYWELCWEVRRELDGKLYWGLDGELYWELRRELDREFRQPLGTQIRTDFSHSKISRV
jgi:hypothetical protein